MAYSKIVIMLCEADLSNWKLNHEIFKNCPDKRSLIQCWEWGMVMME